MVLCCTEKLCGGTDTAPQGAHPLYRLSTASKQKIYQSEKRKVIGQTTIILSCFTRVSPLLESEQGNISVYPCFDAFNIKKRPQIASVALR